MTPSKLQPERLSRVGSPEEQHLLLSAVSDAPSAGLRANLLAQLGLEGPPGSDVPTEPQHSPAPATVQPGSSPVAATATNPFTSWIAWVGVAVVAVGMGYGAGTLAQGNPGRATASITAKVTPAHEHRKPQSKDSCASSPARELHVANNAQPPSVLPGSAVLPETAATLPLPPPVAPALRAKQLAPPVPSANLEITLIDAARAALRSGDPAGCVAKLLERKRKIRGGMLEPEASLLLVQALLAQGRTAQARATGERFLKVQPSGAIADRMRFALAHAGPEPAP